MSIAIESEDQKSLGKVTQSVPSMSEVMYKGELGEGAFVPMFLSLASDSWPLQTNLHSK